MQHVVYYKSILATFKQTVLHKEIKTIHQNNKKWLIDKTQLLYKIKSNSIQYCSEQFSLKKYNWPIKNVVLSYFTDKVRKEENNYDSQWTGIAKKIMLPYGRGKVIGTHHPPDQPKT